MAQLVAQQAILLVILLVAPSRHKRQALEAGVPVKIKKLAPPASEPSSAIAFTCF